jgi:RNA polymerase sigma factor (sigma-70 family)
VSDAATEAQNPPGTESNTDDELELISKVRRGDTAAYGVLYERHLDAARRAAAALAASGAERDDLIAESFARVLRALRGRHGPTETFRPYLLATLRNTLVDWRRRDALVSPVPETPEIVAPGREDPPGARVHALVAAAAFGQLPPRWRRVLWHTEVEQCSPAEVARLLGLTSNGVAALAYRAREALRQAYLDQYTPTSAPRQCRPVVEQLPSWTRHKAGAAQARRITAHLDGCAECRGLAAELRELNQQLPSLLGPLAAGAPLALASLAGTIGTAGTVTAASGVAEAVGASVSIASWTAAAKAVIAGAAVVATTAFGSTASTPVRPATPPSAQDVAAANNPGPAPKSGRSPHQDNHGAHTPARNKTENAAQKKPKLAKPPTKASKTNKKPEQNTIKPAANAPKKVASKHR